MKKIITTKTVWILLVCAISISNKCIAQQPTHKWAKTFGSASVIDMAMDSQKNIYLIGNFGGTVDFDPSPTGIYNLTAHIGDNDFFIVKLDSSGNFKWAKNIGGTYYNYVNKIKIVNGYLLVCGRFVGITDFDPSNSGISKLSTNGEYEGFILKVTTNGDFVWAKALQQTSSPTTYTSTDMYSFDIDNQNNIICTGSFSGTIDFNPSASVYLQTSSNLGKKQSIYFLKLDSNGTFIWAKQIDGSSGPVSSFSLVTDMANNFYVGIWLTSKTTDLDPSPSVMYNITNTGLYDACLAKYNSNGNFVWAKQLGGNDTINSDVTPIGLLIKGNDLYFSVQYNDTLDLDFSTNKYLVTNHSTSPVLIAKYDTAANLKWAKEINGTSGFNLSSSHIAIDDENNVYSAGRFYYGADFDPSPSLAYQVSGWGDGGDCFIWKLDSLGNFKWVQAFGSLNKGDGANAISVDKNYNVYACGYFGGTCDFDPSSAINNITPLGTSDGFVTKFSQPFALPINIKYINAIANQDATTTLNWQSVNETNASHFNIQRSTNGELFTAIGKVAAAGNRTKINNYNYTDMEASNLHAHTLYYRLQSMDKDGSSSYSKIVSVNFEGKQSFSIIPNPAKDFATISFSKTVDKATIAVYDLAGKVVITQSLSGRTSYKLNTQTLTNGVYVIKVNTATGSYNEKLLINK